MSFEALGFVTGHVLVKGCELSPTQRLTLISLASVADAHGESSHPGIGYLAETTGASERTVQRSLEALAAVGLIEDTGERTGRTGRVVVWRMLLPEGTAKAAWPKHAQWRQDVTITRDSEGQGPDGEAAANADTVSGLNDDTVSGLDGANDDIDDIQSRHLRQPAPLIGNQSGNQKTDSSLRSESAAAPLDREQIRRHVLMTPADLRTVMTAGGWSESDAAPWLFVRDGQRRDWLFEAVGEVVGLAPAELTKNGRGRVNGALKQLRDVGADPVEVIRRGRRFVQARGRRPSIFELATLWAEFGEAADDRFGRGDARRAEALDRARRAVS